MSRSAAIASLFLLSACAPGATAPDPGASFQRASEAAFRNTPREEPILIPALRPQSRLQSELTQLSFNEIARWVLPLDEARRVLNVDILTGHMPRATAIVLYEAPRPAGPAGVCSVSGNDVWLRVPNEASLTYQQHLDPPLQPYQRQPFVRWKVVGSTLTERRQGPPDCAAAVPYKDWFDSPSADVLFRAANIIEQAQLGQLRPRLECRQLRYEEARTGSPRRPAPMRELCLSG